METKKILMSIGTAIAASKLAHTVANVDMDDLLGTVGLARRRSSFLPGFGLLLAGAVIGGVAALLLAPESGIDARRRLGATASKLGDKAMEAARDHKDAPLREAPPAGSRSGGRTVRDPLDL